MKLEMKRIFAIATTVCILAGCNFLNVEQVGKSDIEGYFSDPSAVKVAVYGIHNLLYSFADRYMILYPEVAADEIALNTSEATWNLYQNFEVTSDDEVGALGYIWKNGYQIINNSNQIIEHVPGLIESFPTYSDALNTYMAQALFIRAYAHLSICLSFGQNYTYTADASHLGASIITRTLGLKELPSRNTVSEVFDQVIEDLKKSIDLYPDSFTFSKFLPSPLSSKALLARVYLYCGNYSEAERYASEIIESVALTSRDNYVAMFNAMKAPANDEMIYTLSGYGISTGTMQKLYLKTDPKARPTTRVTDLFNEGDIRAAITSYNGDNVVLKYDSPSGMESYTCVPILRASEMYLIRAEARNENGDSNGAAKDIEVLETRAMGNTFTLPSLSKEEMETVIEDERIKELCFEGHRLWDITRRHKNLVRTEDHTSTVSELKYPDYRFILPIPSTELDANKNILPNPSSNE